MSLATKQCVPCQGGIPPLSRDTAETYLKDTPGWELSADATRIQRKFKFRDFANAISFVNRIGELAESEGHHPDIAFGWGYCTVTLYTHKITGLHENDFIMAAKMNEQYAAD
ncbi:MAG: 4a-hydroxytetrahydrobiopterin dehydratase [Gammaproteobacteria bacterium]